MAHSATAVNLLWYGISLIKDYLRNRCTHSELPRVDSFYLIAQLLHTCSFIQLKHTKGKYCTCWNKNNGKCYYKQTKRTKNRVCQAATECGNDIVHLSELKETANIDILSNNKNTLS
jgi:hypothetical protein